MALCKFARAARNGLWALGTTVPTFATRKPQWLAQPIDFGNENTTRGLPLLGPGPRTPERP